MRKKLINKVIGTRRQGVGVWCLRELTTEHLTEASLRLEDLLPSSASIRLEEALCGLASLQLEERFTAFGCLFGLDLTVLSLYHRRMYIFH